MLNFNLKDKALIKNNAEVAGKIAFEYHKLSDHTTIILDENKFIEKGETAFLPEMAPVSFNILGCSEHLMVPICTINAEIGFFVKLARTIL